MKFSRRCRCRRSCGHLARGTDALQPRERLTQLMPVLAILIDCAEAYDSDGLVYDPECGVHGELPVNNVECSCQGERTSAVEFVQALVLDVRSAGAIHRPAGQPNRLHEGVSRLVASG